MYAYHVPVLLGQEIFLANMANTEYHIFIGVLMDLLGRLIHGLAIGNFRTQHLVVMDESYWIAHTSNTVYFSCEIPRLPGKLSYIINKLVYHSKDEVESTRSRTNVKFTYWMHIEHCNVLLYCCSVNK